MRLHERTGALGGVGAVGGEAEITSRGKGGAVSDVLQADLGCLHLGQVQRPGAKHDDARENERGLERDAAMLRPRETPRRSGHDLKKARDTHDKPPSPRKVSQTITKVLFFLCVGDRTQALSNGRAMSATGQKRAVALGWKAVIDWRKLPP